MTDDEAFELLIEILEDLALQKNRISVLAKIQTLKREVLARSA